MTNEEFFNKNINIAYKIAWKYKNCGIDFEDVKQICLYALWKAVITYDDQHSFSNYAFIVIQNEMNHYLRKNRKYLSDKYFSDPVNDDLQLEEILADNSNNFERIEKKVDIQKSLNKLKNNSRIAAIMDLYFKGKTQYEIAKKLNISQALVSREINKLKDLLK